MKFVEVLVYFTVVRTIAPAFGAFSDYFRTPDWLRYLLNYESCDSQWINFDRSSSEGNLKRRFYGQHLAEFTIPRALNAHTKNENPRKALVMSFYGVTGSGKTFVSHMIAESIYKNGMNSKYVHQYIANKDFLHEEKISEYQAEIREDVIRFTKECPRSLFIFDEVDKMPPGILDALTPFVDYHEKVDDVDYRKNIFLFLSNAGSQGIVDTALSFWAAGRDREDITMKDIEPLISKGAVHEGGGFHFGELLRNELIDLYVPFLPLEKKHVRKCTEAYLKSRSLPLSKSDINIIADQLVYYPEGSELYSASGCKRLHQMVDSRNDL